MVVAVRMAMSQQLTAPRSELLRQIVRLFGFQRRSARNDEAVLLAINHLERIGWLTIKDDIISIKA